MGLSYGPTMIPSQKRQDHPAAPPPAKALTLAHAIN